MRKILLLTAALIALLVGGVVAALLLVDVNQFRGTIQTSLESKLNRSVKLGNLGLKLFPLAIRVDDGVVGESPRFRTGRDFARVKSIQVRTSLLSLLRKEIRVESLVLEQPAIELVRNSAGQWNYEDLSSPSSSNSGSGSSVTLRELRIEDGTLAISDLGKPKSRSIYDHVDVALKNGSGNQFSLKASAQIPGSGKESVSLDVSGGSGTGGKLDGRLTVREASLAGIGKFLGSALAVDGLLSGDAEIHSANSVVTAAGQMELKKATSGGKEIGIPLAANFRLAHNLTSGVLKAESLKLTAGRVGIDASGDLDTKASVLNARARLADAQLADVLGLARLFGAGDVSGSGVVSLDVGVQGPLSGTLSYSGHGSLRDAQITTAALTKPLQVHTAQLRFDRNTATITPLECSLAGSRLKGSLLVKNFASPDLAFDADIDKIDTAELQRALAPSSPASAPAKGSPVRLTARGNIRAGTLASQGLVLTNVRSECQLQRGVLTLSPISAQLFGGTHSGRIVVDTNSQPPALAFDMKLDNVDANQLLSATTSVKQTLYGLLAASGDARMKLGDDKELARSLNGALNLKLNKGRLAGTNVMNQLSAVSKFLGYANNTQNFTNIVQLGGDLKIVDGLASTDNLQMQIEGGTVAAAGTVNLADQSINLKLTAVLDRDTTHKVGGNNVGGFLQTALANSKGELVIPAVVTGTLSQPRFTPDAGRVAEMKLKNILPSASNPAGALGGLSNPKAAGKSVLDALRGRDAAQAKPEAGKTEETKPAQPAAPKESILGIIDSLRKKK